MDEEIQQVPITLVYVSKRELVALVLATGCIAFAAYKLGGFREIWMVDKELVDRK